MRSGVRLYAIVSLTCSGVLMLASGAPAAVDRVVCVPWQGDPNSPHTAISGQSVNLYAVIYGDGSGGTVSYSWDFKDGQPPAPATISVPANGIYSLKVANTFNGAINTPFITELTVEGQTDAYKVILAPDNNESKANIAIDKALWYLHTQMVRTNVGSPSVPGGYWNDSGYYVGRTGACVWAFEVQGHLLNVEAAPLYPTEDPYVEDVQRGINYLLSRMYADGMTAQTHGHPEDYDGNGTGDGNGFGLKCYYSSGHTNYETAVAMGAISGCGTPNATADTGNSTYVLNRTYADIVQDMADWYAWSQIDGSSFPRSGSRGGWYYTAANNAAWGANYGDNSACQWAYIGLDSAEANFGCTIPEWVKEQLAGYLHYQTSYSNRGWVSYRSNDNTNNVCLTGGSLVGMVLVGESIYDSFLGAGTYATDLDRVKTFLGNKWHGTSDRWEENWYGHRAYYTMYAVMKGLRLQGITSLPGSPGTSDWYADYVGVMIPDQHSDGHWRGTGWMDGYIREDMGTAFGVLILTPSVFSPPPVACFEAEPNPGYLDIVVTFDPSCSYHSDYSKNLVLYEWDWDDDGTYDQSSPTPDVVFRTWDSATYSLGTYPVTLRVTDDTTPTPVTDTFMVDIDLTTPPHPPVADDGGPYVVSLCAGDSLSLDGSDSYDIDEGQSQSGNPPFDTIMSWDWDLGGSPWDYLDKSGETVLLDAGGIASYFSTGENSIGLKVTDNTEAAYPNSGEPDLTDESFTTVTVYTGCACDLAGESVCDTVIVLSWTTSGTYEVYRSTDGPNTGFAKIDDVTGTGYRDETVTVGVTYYYRLKGTDCMSKYAAVLAVDNVPPAIDQGASISTTVPKDTVCPNAENYVDLSATDAENDPLTWGLKTGGEPATGTVSFVGGNTGETVRICYQPDPGQTASDSFVIQVTDDCGNTDEITVNVTVAERPAAAAWRSLRTHGNGVGPLAITLDPSKTDADTGANGPVSEPRRYGIQQIVVTFGDAVEAADGSLDVNDMVVTDSGSNPYTPSSVALVDGGVTLQINFNAGVLPDEKRYTFELAGKFAKAGTGVLLGGDTNCQIRSLVGDANGDGSTNLIDVAKVKGSNRQPAEAANLRDDVNVDGKINLIDGALTKSLNGNSAP